MPGLGRGGAGSRPPRTARPRSASGGRGPTRLMSPTKHVPQLRQLVERVAAQARPTGVTRGSSFILKSTPLPSLRSCSSASRASASVTIDRNFSIVKRVPCAPTRSCRKSTGPSLDRRTPIAMAAKSGLSRSSGDARHDDVEQPLHGVVEARVLRQVDVHHRQAVDRAEVDARARDVGQARHEDELGVRVLELPAEAPDRRAPAGQVAGDDHRARAGALRASPRARRSPPSGGRSPRPPGSSPSRRAWRRSRGSPTRYLRRSSSTTRATSSGRPTMIDPVVQRPTRRIECSTPRQATRPTQEQQRPSGSATAR